MRTIAALLLLSVFGFASCQKKTVPTSTANADYLIIGSTGGFAGPIAMQDYYLISNGQLKKATLGASHVPDDVSKFNFNTTMPTAKYELVKDLPNSIPAELLAGTTVSIGQAWPDAGYMDVRALIKGKSYVWHFEADQSVSSAEVKAFLDKIEVLYK